MKDIIVQEVKVTRNYQITIPKIIVEKIGLKVGDKVLVEYEDGEIKLKPKKVDILKVIDKLDLKAGEVIDIDKILREDDRFLKKLEKEYKK